MPIRIVADGVVRDVVTRGDGCGVNVTIDHTIGGKLVSSKYCHMQTGSVRVSVGQQVTVGEIVGLVGNTGVSTGAHLHLEIRLDGTGSVGPLRLAQSQRLLAGAAPSLSGPPGRQSPRVTRADAGTEVVRAPPSGMLFSYGCRKRPRPGQDAAAPP
ncbi:M23 family metallopeptidase [Leifsonia xyli]|uniref:M23 family metallopeptidase n=1 Tax=Leifsonia xyli TaxID=1575 RepID=UPI0002E87FFB